ncbi:RNA-binding protein NOB1 [Klebsormidium nitens]|uniref:RNA-binding protein NOB1 n=1 Tax=Klebsormidium nitens TaxID=105231 RepID=A0A1Y1HUB6_KLENI|nr:RNA-binding protein NOB1 [Klebsormidium nitens]|eukprot:GAQ82225.1 RNA-binding protein NOB1 [Klebsormidium nitens]
MGGFWAEAVRRDPEPSAPAKATMRNETHSQINGNPVSEDGNNPSVSSAVVTAEADSGRASDTEKSGPMSEDVGARVHVKGKDGGHLMTLVVDTNAIITGTRLDNIAESLVTITEVFEEIRDKQTRQLLARLPYEIETREPSDAALKEVVRFARATGDLHSLSPPDIKLIALTYTLEAELYGTAHIRREPPPIAVAKKSQARMKDPPGWGKVANPADWAGIDEVGDDGKRPGSSSGFGKGGSRIFGVKPLEGDSVSVVSSSGAGEVLKGAAGLGLEEVSTSLSKIGLEGGLMPKEGSAGLPEVSLEEQGVGTEEQKGESVSESNIEEGVKSEGKGVPSGSEGAAAWGGFMVAPPVAVPLASNSLLSTKPANDSSAPQAVGTASFAEAAPQKNARQSFKQGGGRGGGRGRGRGRGRGAKMAALTKPIVVDGVHAVLVEEQAIEHAEGGDEWERNVSRSTRRKHQRRAERAAGLETPGGVNTGAANMGAVEVGANSGDGPSATAEGHVETESNAETHAEKGGEEKAEIGAAVVSKGVGLVENDQKSEAAAESVRQSEGPASAEGPSGAEAESGGQFSDAEEDEEASGAEEDEPEVESPAADVDDTPADVSTRAEPEDSGEPSGAAEYEYVYSDQEKAPESIQVALPQASQAASEVGSGWDGASSAAGPERESEVACMTSDFAMQNVLLQMGLRLLSVDGLAISQVHRWALRCQACGQVTHEMGRIFCPKCGNGGTLHKVTVMVGEDGALVAGVRKRFSLRGTRYPIPLPKGGREGKQSDPILREDQLPSRIRHGLGPRKKKGEVDVFGAEYGPETWFQAVPTKGVSHNAVHVKNATAAFNSRKNPNERRVARKK